MADGHNQARALRILEIMGDYRTLMEHIRVQTARVPPPDAQSASLVGYATIRMCDSQARTLLASPFNSGELGANAAQVDHGEVTRANLQRIIVDASARRFQAQKIYLIVACAVRWVAQRAQVLQGQPPSSRHTAALAVIDQRFRQEVAAITDRHVFDDLRNNDRRRGYWLNDDPSLERIQSWIRSQR